MAAEPVRPGEPVGELAVDASLRAAALGGSLLVGAATSAAERETLRRKVRVRPPKTLELFVVDGSESMGADARVAAVKGAVLSLLSRSYVDRCRVALVVVGGEDAQVLLPPSDKVSVARDRLRRLRVGGATPLGAGLVAARRLIARERWRDGPLRCRLVLLSDGEVNVPLEPGRPIEAELREQAALLRRTGTASLVIDAAPIGATGSLLVRLADWLGASYHRLAVPHAGRLLSLLDR